MAELPRVNIAQKEAQPGYINAKRRPQPKLARRMTSSMLVGKMVNELRRKTARLGRSSSHRKHGNSPIDPSLPGRATTARTSTCRGDPARLIGNRTDDDHAIAG